MKKESVVIFGRLGIDPDLKYTQRQEPVCTFTLAEQIPGQEKPNWHKVVVWGHQGEDCKLHLKKGAIVFVRGQNQDKEFQAQDGLKKYVELKAEIVGFPVRGQNG